MSATNDLVRVRYMVDDVQESIDFYTLHFGFQLLTSAAPAFAGVVRGRLRLLLAGAGSSAGPCQTVATRSPRLEPGFTWWSRTSRATCSGCATLA